MGGVGLFAGFAEILGASVAGLVYREWLKRQSRVFTTKDLWKFSVAACLTVVAATAVVYALGPRLETASGD